LPLRSQTHRPQPGDQRKRPGDAAGPTPEGGGVPSPAGLADPIVAISLPCRPAPGRVCREPISALANHNLYEYPKN
jgi:hypothetical protein